MVAETSSDLFDIRNEVSHESLKKRSAQKEVAEMVEGLTDETLDKINDIRLRIVTSSDKLENVSERTQALTWKLTNPSEEQLEAVNVIIILGRNLVVTSKDMVKSLEPLSIRGICLKEIEEFKEVVEHWNEVIDDIEAAFFTLPADVDFVNANRELELL
jgi:hypothetical protein